MTAKAPRLSPGGPGSVCVGGGGGSENVEGKERGRPGGVWGGLMGNGAACCDKTFFMS